MNDSFSECLCRVQFEKNRAQVILVSARKLATASKLMSLDFPPNTQCVGNTWISPEGLDGGTVILASYEDPPLPNVDALFVCNAGEAHTESDLANLKKWHQSVRL